MMIRNVTARCEPCWRAQMEINELMLADADSGLWGARAAGQVRPTAYLDVTVGDAQLVAVIHRHYELLEQAPCVGLCHKIDLRGDSMPSGLQWHRIRTQQGVGTTAVQLTPTGRVPTLTTCSSTNQRTFQYAVRQ